MNDLSAEVADDGDRVFKELADFAPVMIWRSAPDKLCDWFNKPWLDFVGRTLEQEQGNGWTEGVHKEDFDPCLETYVAAFDARQPFTMIYRLRRHDGVYRYILDNGAPFYRIGVFSGYFGSCIDITEQREMEHRLRQAQKMDALGKLTGGVAHDFNNVLQIIGGSLELLARHVAGNPAAEQKLRQARVGVERGSKLASQLLGFARRQPLSPTIVDLGRMIRGMDEMLRRALGEEVELETVISEGLWNVVVDLTQAESALLNLTINARDAMNGRGKLTIEAGNSLLDDKYAVHHVGVSPGQYVMIAVTDTGRGMPPEILDQVFDPFFTTKAESKGTGLGLSIVHGFVRQSKGHVKIYSEPGHGTTVRIYLPRTREKEAEREEMAGAPVVGGSETILLVEDDDDVRLTAVAMLSDLGYSVLQAKNADRALAVLESGARIDLLFTDVVMPGTLRSPELARRAQTKFPGITVLFTSGYTDNALMHGGRLEKGMNLLAKPYTRDDLARKIRQVLAQRAATD